jgi:hypothetical protein
MSDGTQVIVDLDATLAEADQLADEVRGWLAAQGVIQPEPSDCVLGDAYGHAPGPRYRDAVVPGSPDEGFLALLTNGLDLRVGRAVFHPGGEETELACDACGAQVEAGEAWTEAVSGWFEGDDAAAFACPACRRSRPLTAWRGPRPWGFGNLGLEFWNWPPLSDAFVRAVGERLGHRVLLVRAHL